MTDPVNRAGGSSAIASLIRQALATRHTSQAGSVQRHDEATRQGGRTKQKAPLSTLIAQRIGGLDPDAPNYQTSLLRVVVETSLLHEFGQELINAPKFQSMVDQVLLELESAPQLKDEIHETLSELASSSRTRSR